MTTTHDAWNQVGDRLSALLLKLKLHAQEEMSEEDRSAMDGLEKVRAVFAEAMDAIGDATKDEAVREDARQAGRAFIDAMEATSKAVQERIRS